MKHSLEFLPRFKDRIFAIDKYSTCAAKGMSVALTTRIPLLLPIENGLSYLLKLHLSLMFPYSSTRTQRISVFKIVWALSTLSSNREQIASARIIDCDLNKALEEFPKSNYAECEVNRGPILCVDWSTT